jgi:predicted Fe-Mo cluster-binding NifX family protein
MKIAVTAKGKDLDAEIDPRFGRALYIIIIDSESMEYEVIDNAENVNALKGAGIQTAALISEKGVDVLLTGFCGPNAFKTLNAGGVKVANDVTGTVTEAVTAFKDGTFSFADNANVEGHW